MNADRDGARTSRQFLAIDPPDTPRQALSRWMLRIADETTGWRWLRPAGIHLTLRFLGNVTAETDTLGRTAWREAARRAQPLTLRMMLLEVFPTVRRPRVLAVSLEDTSGTVLSGLAGRIEEAARALGFPAETRAFRPHMTVARAARGSRPVLPREAVGSELSEEPFRVTRMNLVKSTLTPSGASYTVLDMYPLGGSLAESDAEDA